MNRRESAPPNPHNCSRRDFLGTTLVAATCTSLIAQSADAEPAEKVGLAEKAAPTVDTTAPQRKMKVGLVGCGGRGSWIAPLFTQHGGYHWHAVADYFPNRVEETGNRLGVDKARQFSGLSGYKKVIESGVEALVIIVPPYCIAEMAAAAVDAGVHAYMAKPVAVDVPGCRSIGVSTAKATQSQRVLLVDYQIPTDPNNMAVWEAVRQGRAGKLVRVATVGVNGGWPDPPKGPTIENWLLGAVWNNHIALSGGKNVSYDIHAIDAAAWLIGAQPVAASGCSRIVRPNPQGDSADIASVAFEYADGLIYEHSSMGMPNHTQAELSCKAYSYNSRAFLQYWGDALFQVRGQKPLGGPVKDLYAAGAKRNIAAFYDAILHKDYGNATGERAMNGTLTAILGREAAARGVRLTMEELLKENKRIEADLRGLKV
jgi:myo-inositol 2-dehydrogenase / D-chiro-inositol 1-dehydrogenase